MRQPDVMDKSLPEIADLDEFLAGKPRLSAFSTPLLVLDGPAMDENIARMAAWCAEHGLELAPHGKTTMAPAIWERQLRAGAWGITVANVSQLRVAIAAGVRRVHLANALVDPVGLAHASHALDADPELVIQSWVDSPDTVAAMAAVLGPLGPQRPLDVLVELGVPGGRTGARGQAAALAAADAVAASPHLRLAGVCGYEGPITHGTSAADLAAVAAYLEELAALHRALTYPGDAVVSAGGSSYFDVVAEVLGPLAGPGVHVEVRSGAYVSHDDGLYLRTSPFARHGTPFRSAIHAWARVVSRPEPELALLDAGKRDIPYDIDMPVPQLAADGLGAPTRPLTGEVTKVNDQHAFLSIAPDTPLRVGHVVRLGLSHPCTTFDKWQWIPVVADDGPDPVVTELVRTYF